MQTFGVAQNSNLSAPERYEMLVSETRKSTTTLTDSTQIVVPMATGETFIWRAAIFVQGNAPGDAKIAWATPAAGGAGGTGGTLQVLGGASPVGAGRAVGYDTGIHIVTFAAGADTIVQIFEGRLENGATPGQFTLQLAQNASNVAGTLFLRGTYLEVLRR